MPPSLTDHSQLYGEIAEAPSPRSPNLGDLGDDIEEIFSRLFPDLPPLSSILQAIEHKGEEIALEWCRVLQQAGYPDILPRIIVEYCVNHLQENTSTAPQTSTKTPAPVSVTPKPLPTTSSSLNVTATTTSSTLSSDPPVCGSLSDNHSTFQGPPESNTDFPACSQSSSRHHSLPPPSNAPPGSPPKDTDGPGPTNSSPAPTDKGSSTNGPDPPGSTTEPSTPTQFPPSQSPSGTLSPTDPTPSESPPSSQGPDTSSSPSVFSSDPLNDWSDISSTPTTSVESDTSPSTPTAFFPNQGSFTSSDPSPTSTSSLITSLPSLSPSSASPIPTTFSPMPISHNPGDQNGGSTYPSPKPSPVPGIIPSGDTSNSTPAESNFFHKKSAVAGTFAAVGVVVVAAAIGIVLLLRLRGKRGRYRDSQLVPQVDPDTTPENNVANTAGKAPPMRQVSTQTNSTSRSDPSRQSTLPILPEFDEIQVEDPFASGQPPLIQTPGNARTSWNGTPDDVDPIDPNFVWPPSESDSMRSVESRRAMLTTPELLASDPDIRPAMGWILADDRALTPVEEDNDEQGLLGRRAVPTTR